MYSENAHKKALQIAFLVRQPHTNNEEIAELLDTTIDYVNEVENEAEFELVGGLIEKGYSNREICAALGRSVEDDGAFIDSIRESMRN